MNTIAGWGFTDLAALDRFARESASNDAAKPVDRTQKRWITPERVQAYAATLTEVPKPWQIMHAFGCCYASAIKHRRTIADLLGKRYRAEMVAKAG